VSLEAVADAARGAARVARPLPAQRRRARSGLPLGGQAPRMAATAREGGGVLLYNNFRARIWAPFLKKLGLPAVTPHSARHSFISTLQAQSVEVGLVAKLAGHKNAVVTLSHYTHAVRGGEQAVEMLDRVYSTGT
jgi:integrase